MVHHCLPANLPLASNVDWALTTASTVTAEHNGYPWLCGLRGGHPQDQACLGLAPKHLPSPPSPPVHYRPRHPTMQDRSRSSARAAGARKRSEKTRRRNLRSRSNSMWASVLLHEQIGTVRSVMQTSCSYTRSSIYAGSQYQCSGAPAVRHWHGGGARAGGLNADALRTASRSTRLIVVA